MVGKMPSSQTVLEGQAVAVADVYAEALLGLVEDNTQAEALADELHGLVEAIQGVPGAGELLMAESVLAQAEWFHRIFAGRCSPTLEALLAVMQRKGRLGLLPLLAQRFRAGLNVRQGRVDVTVVSARALDDTQRRELVDTLREITAAEPLLRTRVDGALVGGVRVRIGDREYDGSLASQLERLRQRLKTTMTRSTISDTEGEHEAQG